jgi:hypothetical protein
MQDVLCGRGGLTNQHAGNEWYRRLVQSNRALYKSCPKHTKLLVSKAILQAVQQQLPPGRFLEVNKKDDTGTWCEISYKRAVDKTSQALREREALGAEEQGELPASLQGNAGSSNQDISAAMSDITKLAMTHAGYLDENGNVTGKPTLSPHIVKPPPVDPSAVKHRSKKRKAESVEFVKPSWWNRGAPSSVKSPPNSNPKIQKKPKPERSLSRDPFGGDEIVDPVPPPPKPLETRQTSLFRFLNQTGIFGHNTAAPPTATVSSELSMHQAAFPSNNNETNHNYKHASIVQSMPTDIAGAATRFDQDRRQQSRAQSSASYEAEQQLNVQQQQQQARGSLTNTATAAAAVSAMDALQQQQQQHTSGSYDQARILFLQQQLQQRQQQLDRESAGMGVFNTRTQLEQQSSLAGTFDDVFDPVSLPPSQVHLQNGAQIIRNGGFGFSSNNNVLGSQQQQQQQQANNMGVYDPFIAGMQQQQQQHQHQQQQQFAFAAAVAPQQGRDEAVPPAMNRLTTQASDWLNSFWPLGKPEELAREEPPPPPPTTSLGPGISSTFFKFASSPSTFLSNLKSGVTMYFGDSSPTQSGATGAEPMPFGPGSIFPPPPNDGTNAARRSSLLDDYEDSEMEIKMRRVTSR